MALLPGKKLGSRILRFGHKGPDVIQLHAFLRLQGYDLGAEEDFGYLTKDAVKRWQRDHGLVADGIAGKRFFALALKKDLPIRRRVHVVEPGETLDQISKLYGVGPGAFGGFLHKRTVYPGQRLVFFDREIWAICTSAPRGELGAQPKGTLTGLVYQGRPADSPQGPCVIKPATSDASDVVEIHHYLRTPRARKQTAKNLLESVEAPYCQGLYLPWQAVASLDGRRYLKLLKRLRRNLKPPAMLWVELGPLVPHWKLWGGVDYSCVNSLADRVVLDLPPPHEPGPLFERSRGEELVDWLVPSIHSWKILLKVPVYALQWEFGPEGSMEAEGRPNRLPYQTALSRAFRHGARLSQDEGGFPYYSYRQRSIEYHIRLPHHSLMAEVSAVANRHNLAGLILDELGMEDPRIWQTLTMYFHPASLNISDQ